MKWFLIKFCAFYLACFLCWVFQKDYTFSPVLASALVGFAGSFIPHRGLQAIIYSGSFAGMCSPHFFETNWAMPFVSLIGSSAYFLSKPRFDGFGGRLGAVAFISAAALFITKDLW